MRRLRTAGSRWRLLVHGDRDERGMFNMSHHVSSESKTREPSEYRTDHLLPGTEFDELVVGSAMHVEMMDTGFWWASFGGVVLHVKADRDGRPKVVTVHMPGMWDDFVPGCEYVLNEQPWFPESAGEESRG